MEVQGCFRWEGGGVKEGCSEGKAVLKAGNVDICTETFFFGCRVARFSHIDTPFLSNFLLVQFQNTDCSV